MPVEISAVSQGRRLEKSQIRLLIDRIVVSAFESLELTQLRDRLLPLLMSGQVRVE